mgnify:CR=1 FL=1
MAAVVDVETCTGCGLCVEACPIKAVHVNGGVAVVDEAQCRGCGACANECPNDAIRLPE